MSQDEIWHRLGRIESKIDTLLKADSDKERRLRSVERRLWITSGIFSAVLFLFEFWHGK